MKFRLSQITMATVAATLALGAGTGRAAPADRKARSADKQAAETARPGDNGVVEAAPAVKSIESAGPGRCRLFLEWSVASRPNEDWIVFVHFFDASGEAKLNADFAPDPPTSSWEPGTVVLAPRELNLPAELAGTFDIHVGLYQRAGTGGRAARIDGMTNEAGRYALVGQVKIEDGKAEFLSPQ